MLLFSLSVAIKHTVKGSVAAVTPSSPAFSKVAHVSVLQQNKAGSFEVRTAKCINLLYIVVWSWIVVNIVMNCLIRYEHERHLP